MVHAEGKRIDADVHVQAPNIEALHAYLSSHWRDYLSENGYKRPTAVAHSYPPKSAVLAGAPTETSLAHLQTHVLDRSDYAILNCHYGIEGVRHPYMASALASAVNTWLQAEWLDRDDRLFSSMIVPPHDTALAVQEIKRIGQDRRFLQVYLPARSWEPYGNRRFWPVYEAAVEHDLAIGIHFGGLAGGPPTSVGNLGSYFEEYTAATQLFAAHLLSFIAEGVFDEYPTLRLCLMESGVTWLPTWLWRLDTEWKETRREIPWVHRLPSAYARKHVRLTTQPTDAPDSAQDLAEVIGHIESDEMLLYSSDYPHQHGSDPEQLLSVLSSESRERVLHSNAWNFYGLGERVAARTLARP